MARRLSEKVTVYTDGAVELSQTLEEPLKREGFELVTTPIAKINMESGHGGVTVDLNDGSTRNEGFLVCPPVLSYYDTPLINLKVHKPISEVNGPFAQQLSLQLTQGGDISVKPPFYETTSVPGVFAVGDCGSVGKAVAQATSTGLWCASGLVAQLQAPVAKV
jgi:hypothetical protein